MATASEVKAGLDDIAQTIRTARQQFVNSKAQIQARRNDLANIPTAFSDVIATIDGYTGADAFEMLATAEKSRLQAEFVALRDELDALIGSF
jgi:hypothetical protein